MIVYLAAWSNHEEALRVAAEIPNCGVLFSYYIAKVAASGEHKAMYDVAVDVAGQGVPVFCDSGAFSAHMQGITIDLDKYAQFCVEHAGIFTTFATLDVIGDWKATKANTERLEAAGVDALPVFHIGSPWAELDRLAERYDYLGLGGMASPHLWTRTKAKARWIAEAFRRVGDTKVHGFGISGQSFLMFPWHSIDSTAWANKMVHHSAFIRNGRRLASVDAHTSPNQFFRATGLVPDGKLSQTGRVALMRHNAKVLVEWSQEVNACS